MSDHDERRINPIEYGQLLQSVETLTKSVDALSIEVKSITERMNTGKGVVFGLMIASGRWPLPNGVGRVRLRTKSFFNPTVHR